MTHTPGPFEAVRLDPEDGDSWFIEETGQRGIIAEVFHICTDEWTEGNAHLFEGAPDLLAAAKWILTDAMDREECYDEITGEMFDDFQALTEAINKCEGR